ncbi:MAG: lysophospholipid acyltransferase family protein [Candidatus Binatus sp.]|uniref:lysophospholipid acyltransferase family protein n=1 Tax=Candidatus Binatus sp. TaxID=2811406 RepID=UPI002721245E|nr:lysophospholipid acyltransferase family protein [Candidatus Binatus sp.]MDO8434883.1 lysophospholipid acyltransferase family protein [Candidatus Binatus sp.]
MPSALSSREQTRIDRTDRSEPAIDPVKNPNLAPADDAPPFPLNRGVGESQQFPLGFKDRMIYRLLLGALHAFSLLPDFVLYPLGVGCALLFYRFDGRHVKIGLKNLEIAFPERSEAERRRILRASYMNLGRTAAEYVRMGGFFYRRLKDRVGYSRTDIWKALQPKYQGIGALILTAHFGNFELLPAGHALHGYQISLVHHTQRFLAGDALMTFIRERIGVKIIRKHKAAREMLRTLKHGDLIGIPFDQNAKRSEAIWVPFFGEMAATPGGFDRLAMMAGCPVVPAFIVRQPDGRSHVIEVQEEIEQQRTGDKDADALANTARYQLAIEAMVRKYPEQWLWTHRRYRTRPVRGSKSIYD